MKNLFLCATGQDTGGWNWRIVEAFRRFAPDWSARSMIATRTYIDYPEDLPLRLPLLLEMYAEADVVHLQNQTAGWELYDDGAGKPTILQHHGTIFREDHRAISRAARRTGMVEIASTLDLTLLEPGVAWVPCPYNLDELEAIRREEYVPGDGVIRIAHAPTNRDVKGTDHFLAVCERLAERHRIEVILIERRSWADCLRMKARADVYYDQLTLGYGNNAIEAWGMGLPVIAGVSNLRVQREMQATWGAYPFAFAQPESLERVLEDLITSAAARQEFAGRGLAHFRRWHDEATVVRTLAEIYSAAPATVPGPLRRRTRVEDRRRRIHEERLARRAQRMREVAR